MSVDAITANVDALMEKLYKRPLGVPHAVRPTILTSSMVKGNYQALHSLWHFPAINGLTLTGLM